MQWRAAKADARHVVVVVVRRVCGCAGEQSRDFRFFFFVGDVADKLGRQRKVRMWGLSCSDCWVYSGVIQRRFGQGLS